MGTRLASPMLVCKKHTSRRALPVRLAADPCPSLVGARLLVKGSRAAEHDTTESFNVAHPARLHPTADAAKPKHPGIARPLHKGAGII